MDCHSAQPLTLSFHKFIIPAALVATLSACGGGSSNGGTFGAVTGGTDQPNNSTSTNETLDSAGCAESLGSGELGASFTLINTASACDYYLQGEIVLRGELIIEAGTTIVAGIDSQLRIIGGSLISVGTENSPITFQGEASAKGFWKGILLQDARPSRVEHVVIRDAGQVDESRFEPHAALDVNSSTLSLKHVSVSNSFVNGVSFRMGSVITNFSSNVFFGNSLAGLSLTQELVSQLDIASDYLGEASPNGSPVVEIHDHDYKEKPIGNATWKALNAPYDLLARVFLGSSREQLTLEPGVEIITKERIYEPISMRDGGRLSAVGSAEKPIIITSGTTELSDDSIEVGTEGEAILDHVIINDYKSGILASGGKVSISNTMLNVVDGFGIRCFSQNNELTIGDGVTVSDSAEALISPEC